MARIKLPGHSQPTKLLIDWATLKGWAVEKCKGGHLAFTHPRIQGKVFASLTPSCSRGWKNSRSLMRQKMIAAGYKPDEVR